MHAVLFINFGKFTIVQTEKEILPKHFFKMISCMQLKDGFSFIDHFSLIEKSDDSLKQKLLVKRSSKI